MQSVWTKPELRCEAQRRRAAAARADPGAGEALAARAPDWLFAAPGQVVSAYWPIRGEIDPRPLMGRLLAAGLVVVLPETPAHDRSGVLKFREWRPADALRPGRFGLLEPSSAALERTPQIVLAPLLAFDKSGGRLGYGGGFYDRTAARLRGDGGLRLLGLAYAAQEVDRVPSEPHDERLDGVLTERGFAETPCG